jgi:hypothetical protein
MAIVAAQSVSHFFGERVEDAMRSRRVDATEGAVHYLVGLLADYAHPDGRTGVALERPLTLLFDEALRVEQPAERFERLRTLGDGVLYGCGFFGDHFEARGVDTKYLHGLGTRAYSAAGSLLKHRAEDGAGVDLFGELASKFAAFVDVVQDVADASIAMSAESPRALLQVYERWLRKGSDRLASALAARGMVPMRGAKGTLQ